MQELIKKDKYQVFIMTCPAWLPFIFARHPWFVLNKKDVVSRWEVKHFRNIIQKDFGHIHLNAQPPFQGITLTFFVKKPFWNARLLGYIEGDENSVAQKIIEFIENSNKTYPYLYKYSFTGPNSNTYAEWVLDNFPELDKKLSWRFIGKGYKVK